MNLRIPCDWGLEIGLLSEVYRNVRTSKIAQVDLVYLIINIRILEILLKKDYKKCVQKYFQVF